MSKQFITAPALAGAALFSVWFQVVIAQSPFNKTLGNPNGLEFGWTVYQNFDSTFTILAGGSNSQFTLGVVFIKAKPSGDQLFKKSYFNPITDYYVGLSHTMKKLPNKQFFFAGSSDYYNSFNSDVIVSKLDSTGDTLFFKPIETGNTDAAYNNTPISDGGFAITGYTTPDSITSTNLLLMKVDSDGNHLWHQSYGGNEADEGTSIYEISKHRLIVAGIKRYTTTNFAPWILVTDSTGNILKEKEWNSGALYCGATSLALSLDSQYFIEGCLDTLIESTDYPLSGFVAKLDSSLNILWMSVYNSVNYSSFYIVKQLPDSSIVGVGFQTEEPSNNTRGWIAKLDKYGNKQWEHTYKYGNSTFNYFSDFQQTGDKGFIITGSTIGSTSQDVWLVKLDSLGCLNPNECFTGDLTIEINNQNDFRIAPNPAYDQTNIIYNIPQKLSRGEFVITDLSGKKVGHFIAETNNNTLPLDVSLWPQGVYICSLVSNGHLVNSKKFVVIRD